MSFSANAFVNGLNSARPCSSAGNQFALRPDAMPLAWPLSCVTLPSLPSLSSLPWPDSQQWQRRLLRYLIRRSLGGLLEIPEERIDESTYLDADLSNGSVKLRAVQLNIAALSSLVNAQCETLGIRLDVAIEHGTIGSVELLLGNASDQTSDTRSSGASASGTTERLLNAPIRLKIDDVRLDVCLRPKELATEVSVDDDDDARSDTTSHQTDLAASTYDAAADYLRESTASQLPAMHDEDDPFAVPGAFDNVRPGSPDKEQIGVIASIIERILTRLKISVGNLCVRVTLDKAPNALELEIRLRAIDSHTTISEAVSTRTLDIVEPSIWVRCLKAQIFKGGSPLRRNSEDSSSSDDTDQFLDSNDYLAMSTAITDLRLSHHPGMEPSLESSESSIFVDARQSILPSRSDSEWSQIFGLGSGTVSPGGGLVITTQLSIARPVFDGRSEDPVTTPVHLHVKTPIIVMAAGLDVVSHLGKWISRIPNGLASSAPAGRRQEQSKLNEASSISSYRLNMEGFAFNVIPETSAGALGRYMYNEQALRPPGTFLGLRLGACDAAFNSKANDARYTIRSVALGLYKRESYLPILTSDPGLLGTLSTNTISPGDQLPALWDWTTSRRATVKQWRTRISSEPSQMSTVARSHLLSGAVSVKVLPESCTVSLHPLQVWIDMESLLSCGPILQDLVHEFPQRKAAIPTRVASSDEEEISGKTRKRLRLALPLLRVNVRCPSPTTGTLRAGILVVDLHNVHAAWAGLQPAPSTIARTRFESTAEGSHPVLDIACERVVVMVAPSIRAIQAALCVLVIKHDTQKDVAALRLKLRQSGTDKKGRRLLITDCSVAKTTGAIRKTELDSLQYTADDLAQSVDVISGVFRDPEMENTRDPNAIMSTTDETGVVLSSINLRVDSVSLAIRNDSSGTTEESRQFQISSRSLVISCRPSESVIDLAIQDASFEVTAGARTDLIVSKQAGGSQPLLRLVIASSPATDGPGKKSRIALSLHHVILNVSLDTEWIAELVAILQAPPDAFTDLQSAEMTDLNISIGQSLIRLSPQTLPSSICLKLQQISFGVRLNDGEAVRKSHAHLHGISIWVIERSVQLADFASLTVGGISHVTNLAECFSKDAGFASLGHMEDAKFVLEQLPCDRVRATISGLSAKLTLCPDSMLCLVDTLGDLSKPSQPVRVPAAKALADLSGSVIMPQELAHAISTGQPTRPVKSSAFPTLPDGSGDTIRVCGEGPIQVTNRWFLQDRNQASKPDRPIVFELQCDPASISISLHEGYDFESTRRDVRNAVKATRRKLEKIRQLLAEGQTPEVTADDVADNLLQSIFLPPPSDEDDQASDANDDFERIVAFDDELDREEAMYLSSGRHGHPMVRRDSTSSITAQIRTSELLKRRRVPAVEIKLRSFKANFKRYGDQLPVAGRATISIEALEILDRMVTSTWNKFLTELRPREGGLIRPTDAPMVSVKAQFLRAEASDATEELAIKAQISPLRLHVDQDVLDFLKAFFSFKPANLASTAPKPSLSPGQKAPSGFVRRFEVLPVKIKLDYKPKRVDYRALRTGKTIELMNFFSFEGSDMVLRHVVLSGVTSLARAGEMLQDIWTPDVKAHQLADFLAGIDPVRSVVNVGSGVADLVLLPIQQVKKDGRLGRGLQRGTSKFAKATVLEAAKLGARLATGTQVILERAEHVLGGTLPPGLTATSSRAGVSAPTGEGEDDEQGPASGPLAGDAVSRFSEQPADIREGVEAAYKTLSRNMRTAAETILAVPMEVYDRSGGGPARAVVRAVPIAVLRPMAGASEAVSKTLLGLRNSLDPGAQDEMRDKYKRPNV